MRPSSPSLGGDRTVEMRDIIREYLKDMSRELSIVAYNNGMDSLAVLFDMVREEAERLRVQSDEHLERP
jgi:hypothetical protein